MTLAIACQHICPVRCISLPSKVRTAYPRISKAQFTVADQRGFVIVSRWTVERKFAFLAETCSAAGRTRSMHGRCAHAQPLASRSVGHMHAHLRRLAKACMRYARSLAYLSASVRNAHAFVRDMAALTGPQGYCLSSHAKFSRRSQACCGHRGMRVDTGSGQAVLPRGAHGSVHTSTPRLSLRRST